MRRVAEEKDARIVTKKFGEVTEADYRGVLAIILVLGAMVISLVSVWNGNLQAFTTVMAILGPVVTLVVRDYFKSRE